MTQFKTLNVKIFRVFLGIWITDWTGDWIGDWIGDSNQHLKFLEFGLLWDLGYLRILNYFRILDYFRISCVHSRDTSINE